MGRELARLREENKDLMDYISHVRSGDVMRIYNIAFLVIFTLIVAYGIYHYVTIVKLLMEHCA